MACSYKENRNYSKIKIALGKKYALQTHFYRKRSLLQMFSSEVHFNTNGQIWDKKKQVTSSLDRKMSWSLILSVFQSATMKFCCEMMCLNINLKLEFDALLLKLKNSNGIVGNVHHIIQ